MSSPGSPTANAGASKTSSEQVTFKFCPECSNMLYPKEDKDARRLMYTCRTCQHTEEATSNCIYRNVLRNTVGETAGVTQDVASDPTVGDAPPTSPSSCNNNNNKSALVICGCCGQVIMCSDCGLHPAVVSGDDQNDDDDLRSSPPETYQEELLEQMIVDEDALNRMMNNIVDMAGLMELDEDMEDWEPEDDPTVAKQHVHGGPSEAVAA